MKCVKVTPEKLATFLVAPISAILLLAACQAAEDPVGRRSPIATAIAGSPSITVAPLDTVAPGYAGKPVLVEFFAGT